MMHGTYNVKQNRYLSNLHKIYRLNKLGLILFFPFDKNIPYLLFVDSLIKYYNKITSFHVFLFTFVIS